MTFMTKTSEHCVEEVSLALRSEAIRRVTRGEEGVVGIIETQGRKATPELPAKVEVVPRRTPAVDVHIIT